MLPSNDLECSLHLQYILTMDLAYCKHDYGYEHYD